MVRSADGARESKLGGETTQEKLRRMKALQVVAKQALPSELLPPSEPPPTESQKASDKDEP